MLQGYLFGPFPRPWIQADLAQQCSRGAFSDLFGDTGSKRTLRNNAPGVPFRTFSETLDPSGPCTTMLQGYLFGDPGSKRTLRNNAPGVPFRTFSETLDPSGPCATMLQGYLFGPFRRPWIQADLAQQCSSSTFSDLFGDPGSKRTLRNNAPGVPFRTFSETLDPSGPCATMLQGYLFGLFRRPWIQADLAQQCSRGTFSDLSKRTLRNNAPGVPFRTFSETLDPSGPCATMLHAGVPFRTFSETLDPSGPCATMLQGYLFGPIQADLAQQCSRGTFLDLFGDPGSKRTLRNNAPGVPFRTFSETLDPSGPCATMLQGYLFGPFRRP